MLCSDWLACESRMTGLIPKEASQAHENYCWTWWQVSLFQLWTAVCHKHRVLRHKSGRQSVGQPQQVHSWQASCSCLCMHIRTIVLASS